MLLLIILILAIFKAWLFIPGVILIFTGLGAVKDKKIANVGVFLFLFGIFICFMATDI